VLRLLFSLHTTHCVDFYTYPRSLPGKSEPARLLRCDDKDTEGPEAQGQSLGASVELGEACVNCCGDAMTLSGFQSEVFLRPSSQLGASFFNARVLDHWFSNGVHVPLGVGVRKDAARVTRIFFNVSS